MRILALDVGKRRIGIALSDPLGVTARPYATIPRDRGSVQKILQLVTETGSGLLLVGLPVHLDGSEGEQAKDVRKFADSLLLAGVTVPLEFVDERLSTVEAEQRLSDRRGSWRKNRDKIDAFAAAIILEAYLKER